MGRKWHDGLLFGESSFGRTAGRGQGSPSLPMHFALVLSRSSSTKGETASISSAKLRTMVICWKRSTKKDIGLAFKVCIADGAVSRSGRTQQRLSTAETLSLKCSMAPSFCDGMGFSSACVSHDSKFSMMQTFRAHMGSIGFAAFFCSSTY